MRSLSHNLRTPLNSIISLIDCTKIEGEGNETARKSLQIARSSSNILLHKIDDMVDYSKIEINEFKPNFTFFSPQLLIEEVLSFCQTQAELAGVQLIFHVPENIPERIKSDRKRIRQILIHLVLNGINHTQKNGFVEIKLENETNHVTFIVKDNGIGMNQETQKKIFNLFSQENANVKGI